MKPRDRVRMSLRHEKPDRCPMQISFTPEFARRLRDDMHQTGRSAHNPHGGGNTYELECALNQDMLLTSVGWANSYYANETYASGRETYTDEWSVGWKNAPTRPASAADSTPTSLAIRWPTVARSIPIARLTRTGRSFTGKPNT